MKISELSKITGVSTRSIRHYENKNLLVANRLDNGYREFNESAINRIKTIQYYLSFGLTTDQIGEILDCLDNNMNQDYDDYCEEMLKIYKEKLHEINTKVHTLSSVKHRIEKQINQF